LTATDIAQDVVLVVDVDTGMLAAHIAENRHAA
jgi:tetrahydromethanopterin S-methyltransferase subunit B